MCIRCPPQGFSLNLCQLIYGKLEIFLLAIISIIIRTGAVLRTVAGFSTMYMFGGLYCDIRHTLQWFQWHLYSPKPTWSFLFLPLLHSCS